MSFEIVGYHVIIVVHRDIIFDLEETKYLLFMYN